MDDKTYRKLYSSDEIGKDPYDNVEFKEISRTKKPRKKKHYFLRFLIFVGIIIGIGLFLSSPIFNISKIAVNGNKYFDDNEVVYMADARLEKNIFWGAGDRKIKDRLKDNPYISEVKIKRKLPGTLIIDIVEKTQVAAIVYGDKFVVINEEGIVLRKSNIDPKVTLITGLTISKLKVGEKVEAEEAQTLKNTLNMLVTMENGDIYFKKIDVSGVTIKAYIYDTLIVKGTPKQMLKAIDAGNLQKVVNNLFNNNTTRGTISLADHNYMSFSPNF